MTLERKQAPALKFLSILGKPDADVVKEVAVEDVVWTFPGESIISGEARGIDAILMRAKTIASHKVKVEVIRTIYGFSGVAVLLHNTAQENGKALDEHLAAVFAFRGDKIERLDTHLSDVPMVKAFFG
ncbi:MAG TPA: nuclear transport factor 2 family protein [Xanthobacteraceae bacterium]|nr:nuclear transport factor 2 family protein [Xanthobacteraceae bacterium]